MERRWSNSQTNAMQITERVTSIFSMLGILFIISTFLLCRGFDKPINRLIFFASWSNLGMNVATLIAEDGPAAGRHSALCQFQGWAIQMFLGVDALWALCMSVNVYLALFRGWTAQRMRAQEWKYIVICYGVSFIPALTYLFIETKDRGKIYGDALLWCWVTTGWDFLRIATLYGIVWVAIGSAFMIYCLAFRKVWHNRHKLSGLFNPFNEDPFAGQITTEIEIVRESVHIQPPAVPAAQHYTNPTSRISGDEEDVEQVGFNPYTVKIQVGPQEKNSLQRHSRSERFRLGSLTRNAALNETNPDAWLYARVAFLFFCALLISWIPASINRLYSLAKPDRAVYGLNFFAIVVLPLQGFWNFCVYVITSQTAVRNLFRPFMGKEVLPRKSPCSDGLDSASGDRGAKAMGIGMVGVTAGLGKTGENENKLNRFAVRRASLRDRDGRQRLHSDDSSVTNLTTDHHK